MFSTKIGYSLSTTPNVICNFLSMDDISGAVLENPDSTVHHAECSFVVQVQSSGGETEDTASNQIPKRKIASDSEPSENDEAGSVLASISDTEKQLEAALAPQPYHLQAASIAERDQWIATINATLRAYQRNKEEQASQRGSALLVCQLRLRSFYNGLLFQTSTALLVAVNFFVTVSAARPPQPTSSNLCWRSQRIREPIAAREHPPSFVAQPVSSRSSDTRRTHESASARRHNRSARIIAGRAARPTGGRRAAGA